MKYIIIAVLIIIPTMCKATTLITDFNISDFDTNIGCRIWQIHIENLWFQYVFINNEYKIIGGNTMDPHVYINGEEYIIPIPGNSWVINCGEMDRQNVKIETVGDNFTLYLNNKEEISGKFNGKADTVYIEVFRILTPFTMNCSINNITLNDKHYNKTNIADGWVYDPFHTSLSDVIESTASFHTAWFMNRR